MLLLLNPTAHEHLQVLSRLALVLREQKLVDALKARNSAEDIFSIIDSLEPSNG